MSYPINHFNGNLLTTVADGTVDGTTNLSLPGPNFVGYGSLLNENLVYLLENFASDSSHGPTKNLIGQLWFNTTEQKLQVFTTNGFTPVSGVTNSGIPPLNATSGDIWYNQGTNQTFIFDNGAFNLIGPQYTKTMGVSGAIPTVINDGVTSGLTHNVVQLQFGNVVIATFSGDAAFNPSPTITGIPTIFPGLTINNSLFTGSAQFYTNANTATYLASGVDSTIIAINSNAVALNSAMTANVTAANAAIVTANSAVVSYINSQISAVNTAWQSNAVIQNNQLTAANAAIVTANSAVVSYVNSINASMVANVTAVNVAIASLTTSTNANAASQQTQINTLQTQVYANANVAAFLTNNAGNISANTVTATTQNYNDNSTKVATTAFVQNVLPMGAIIMWGGATNTVPTGWQLCDGTNGTPNLRDRFVVGAGLTYSTGNIGGVNTNTISNVAPHTHTTSLSGTTDAGGAHSHTATSTSSSTVGDNGHHHLMPGDDQLSYAANFGSGWTARSAGAFPYDATSVLSGGGQVWETSDSTTGVTVSTSTSTSISTATTHTHTLSLTGNTGSTGSNYTVENRPPYYALCYIQKMF